MTNSKKTLIGAVCAGLLACSTAASATTVLFEDFEDSDVSYSTSAADDLSQLSGRDYYGRVSNSDLPSNISYDNVQGDSFFAVQDTNGAGNPIDSLELNWTGLDIIGLTNLSLSFMFAESDANDGEEDWDRTSSVKVAVQIDGGGFDTVFAIESVPGNDPSDKYNETNSKAAVDTNFDGRGDGVEITSAFSLFGVNISEGSSLDIRLTLTDINANDEDIAFDNVLLTGDPLFDSNESDQLSPVPLPAGGLLLGSALLGLGIARRRKKS